MSNPMGDLQALVAFGRMGLMMAASRMLSGLSLLGLLFLAWWVASTAEPSWQSVVVVGMVALCFLAAVRAETGHRPATAAEGASHAP